MGHAVPAKRDVPINELLLTDQHMITHEDKDMNVSKPEVPEDEAAQGKTHLSVKDASSAEFPKCYFRIIRICSV